MAEIDILDVGMGDKMRALACWNMMCFLYFCAGKYIYIYIRKITGKYTTFKEKCWKDLQKVVTTLLL